MSANIVSTSDVLSDLPRLRVHSDSQYSPLLYLVMDIVSTPFGPHTLQSASRLWHAPDSDLSNSCGEQTETLEELSPDLMQLERVLSLQVSPTQFENTQTEDQSHSLASWEHLARFVAEDWDYDSDFHFDTTKIGFDWKASSRVGSISTASEIVEIHEYISRSKMLSQLAEIENTGVDQRLPHAAWPTFQAFGDAAEFIRRLPLATVTMPEISLAEDGEINFMWRSSKVTVDLGFYGSHTFSYFAWSDAGERLYGDDVLASEGLPFEVKEMLMRH